MSHGLSENVRIPKLTCILYKEFVFESAVTNNVVLAKSLDCIR